MKKILFVFIFLTYFLKTYSQNEKILRLDDVINIAVEQSLEAFRAKNMYLIDYWDYRFYKAEKLPLLNLSLNPLEYNKTMTKRYDFIQNIDLYREQKNINSYANLSLSQNIPYTGGSVYIDSDLSRLVNFGDTSLLNYNATLIRFGVKQPIFGFNKQKWDKKISPLKYEIAKKEYIQNIQEIKLKAVELYFSLLSAYAKYETAEQNIATADTLYNIGKKKYNILSTQYQELLQLEQNKINAENEKIKAKQEINKANFKLNSFLNFDKNTIIKVQIPNILYNIKLSVDDVIEKANTNNPKISRYKLKKLKAKEEYEKTLKENRFKADIIASYGLNQYSENISDVYRKPLTQEIVMLNFQIPLIDWGKSKGIKQIAINNKKVSDIEHEQFIKNFEQNIMLKVPEFNIQEILVKNAKKSYEISSKSYEITKKKFFIGETDMLQLNDALRNSKLSKENYINSIYLFWKNYYEIQQITHFDYKNKIPILVKFEKLIEN